MSRLQLMQSSKAEEMCASLQKDLARRLTAAPDGVCPIDLTASFIKLCHAQTCGKCVPCRVGLGQLQALLEQVANNEATPETLTQIRSLAQTIYDSADCALGSESAGMVLKGLDAFADEYKAHIEQKTCPAPHYKGVPCVNACPAHVDIPGYIALVGAQRYQDAIRLIRKDNPFPSSCAMICEHPCEKKCRRSIVDDAVNIRGLKLSAAVGAGIVPTPECLPATGKKIAVIGGGPSGLTAAYYLQLMGHSVTVFERRPRLGGMLVYGIPSYRLPRQELQRDIDGILSTGVEVKLNTNIGGGEGDVSFETLRGEYDAIYLSNGAHTDKKVGIEGEGSEGVISAVEMLGAIGNGIKPDFSGKTVCVIGGGNVAMDVTRSAIRLGAKKVTTVYRRRIDDMTALPEEIMGAVAEGAEMLELHAPARIEADENGRVTALWATPNMIGPYDRNGRPAPVPAGLPDVRIPCDLVLVAIGQNVESAHFEACGVATKRGAIVTGNDCAVKGMKGVFSGGDCATGPATVIRAIAAGKTAAANIDAYLGFNHRLRVEIDIPTPAASDIEPCGRVNMTEREAAERKDDFELMECPMTCAEAKQEAGRCLRCDCHGYGSFRGGRKTEW